MFWRWLARKFDSLRNHNYMSASEHLLLAVWIKLGQGVAVNVLQKMGLDPRSIVRMAAEKQVPAPGPEKTKMALHYSVHAAG